MSTPVFIVLVILGAYSSMTLVDVAMAMGDNSKHNKKAPHE